MLTLLVLSFHNKFVCCLYMFLLVHNDLLLVGCMPMDFTGFAIKARFYQELRSNYFIPVGSVHIIISIGCFTPFVASS